MRSGTVRGYFDFILGLPPAPSETEKFAAPISKNLLWLVASKFLFGIQASVYNSTNKQNTVDFIQVEGSWCQVCVAYKIKKTNQMTNQRNVA